MSKEYECSICRKKVKNYDDICECLTLERVNTELDRQIEVAWYGDVCEDCYIKIAQAIDKEIDKIKSEKMRMENKK